MLDRGFLYAPIPELPGYYQAVPAKDIAAILEQQPKPKGKKKSDGEEQTAPKEAEQPFVSLLMDSHKRAVNTPLETPLNSEPLYFCTKPAGATTKTFPTVNDAIIRILKNEKVQQHKREAGSAYNKFAFVILKQMLTSEDYKNQIVKQHPFMGPYSRVSDNTDERPETHIDTLTTYLADTLFRLDISVTDMVKNFLGCENAPSDQEKLLICIENLLDYEQGKASANKGHHLLFNDSYSRSKQRRTQRLITNKEWLEQHTALIVDTVEKLQIINDAALKSGHKILALSPEDRKLFDRLEPQAKSPHIVPRINPRHK